MGIILLDPENPAFPHHSLTHESGISAVGGVVNTTTLLESYKSGCFPWYSDDFPVWWNPNPRFVLFPEELKVSKSMRSYFNKNKYTVTFNTHFTEVILNCKSIKRKGQAGTWINEEMVNAYTELHKMGIAHSIEVWRHDRKLVGGLYGIAMGKVFFGESMFSYESNASKYGFITLVKKLQLKKFMLIDCQQETDHLASLGARLIPRENFMEILEVQILIKPEILCFDE